MKTLKSTLFAIIFLLITNSNLNAQCLPIWTYRAPVNINNTNAANLTNFQVKITLNTQALVTAGKMLGTGADIRFADLLCNNIPYWIESGINTPSTVIWLKVPSLPGNTLTTINMYYGNVLAPAASSAANTFELFDNFSGATLDALKWTVEGNTTAPVVGGGQIQFATVVNTGSVIRSIAGFSAPVWTEMKVNSASGSFPSLAQLPLASQNGYSLHSDATLMYLDRTLLGPNCNTYGSFLSNSTTHNNIVGIWQLAWPATGSEVGVWPGGSLLINDNANPNTGTVNMALGLLCSGSGTLDVDWARIRKFAANDITPTIAAEFINIDDNNACTIDAVDPATGLATHTPVVIDDNNICTTDACNTLTGAITNIPVNTNDNNLCTTDGCSSTTGIFHNPVNASDGDPCTNDACNTLTGTISNILDLPVVTATAGQILCYGGTTCVNVSATGGLPPYSGTGPHCGFPLGSYTFSITDARGCSADGSVSIGQPTKLNVTTSTTPSNCAVGTGTATAAPTGGTPGYSYEWKNSSSIVVGSLITATGLTTGVYIVKVTDANGCTSTAAAGVGVTGSAPSAPGPINGPSGICKGQGGVLFCVPQVAGVASYNWVLPTGATGTSSGPCITVNFSSAYGGGFICVTAQNPCGISTQVCKNLPLITKKPVKPGLITGLSTVCLPSTNMYCVPNVPTASSYIWSINGNGGNSPLTIVSGQGTNCVMVNAPSGYNGHQSLRVRAVNCKGNGDERKLEIDGLTIPAMPGIIGGPSPVCKSQIKAYSTGNVNGATIYNWAISGGATIASGQGTKNITVNFSTATLTTATLSVTAGNGCGLSSTRTKLISVNLNCKISASSITEKDPEIVFDELIAFPNPTSGKITISFHSEGQSKIGAKIFDLLGRAIINEEIEVKEGINLKDLDLSEASKGIYLLRLEKEGTEIKTIRIIVE